MATRDDAPPRDTKGEGAEIKSYRESKGLTQAQLAAVVFAVEPLSEPTLSQIRIVGNIERGERPLADDERRRLSDAFPDLAIEPAPLPPGPHWRPAAFRQAQQEMLRKNKGVYEIWLLNGEAAPMLESGQLRDSWVENITAGINYWIVWNLDQVGESPEGILAFRKFAERAASILADVERERKENLLNSQRNPVGIDVFQFHWNRCHDPSCGVDHRCRHYSEGPPKELNRALLRGLVASWAVREALREHKDTLRFHEPFCVEALKWQAGLLPAPCSDPKSAPLSEEFKDDAREGIHLFQNYFFGQAATVVYVPLPGKAAYARAALELDSVKADFENDAGRHHIILSDKAANRLSMAIAAFQSWHKQWEEVAAASASALPGSR